MRSSSLLGILLAIGVIVQIGIGESGFAISIPFIHAAIGFAGLALVIAYMVVNRRYTRLLIISGILLLLVLIQTAIGTHLLVTYLSGDAELIRSVKSFADVHRFVAYALLIVGLIGGVLATRIRRSAS